MAKEIIILEVWRDAMPGLSLRYVFWFPIPPARRMPLDVLQVPTVYRDATPEEIAALQDGSVLEEVYEKRVEQISLAQIKAMLEAQYAARATDIAGLPSPNQFYGAYFDGTTWVVP